MMTYIIYFGLAILRLINSSIFRHNMMLLKKRHSADGQGN